MINSWLSLAPPLFVIFLSAVTRNILFSLALGIFSSLLIIKQFDVADALTAFGQKLWTVAEFDMIQHGTLFWDGYNIFICLFLLLLGIIITLVHRSGGAHAYSTFILRYLKTTRAAEQSSLFLSLLFHIDDYFSALTVGSVMTPVTDQFKIPRAKLALLVSSMATPLVLLSPISSWAAEIIVQIKRSGISLTSSTNQLFVGDPFITYLIVVPCSFYAIITIFSMLFLTATRASYGTIKTQETIAQSSGNLFGGKQAPRQTTDDALTNTSAPSMIDFILPLGTLFLGVFAFALYFGGWQRFGGTESFFMALQVTKIAPSLFLSALVSLIISTLFLIARGRITVSALPKVYAEGIAMMLPSIVMILLIWTFSGIIRDDLGTGEYLARIFFSSVSITMIPVFFFLISGITSVIMGSAWGTIGIYFPIASTALLTIVHMTPPVPIETLPIIYLLFGAIISGAIIGNHIAPIADIIVMVTSSTGSYHVDVVQVALTFFSPCIIASCFAFLCAGIMLNAGASLLYVCLASIALGTVVSCILISSLSYFSKN